ncbi:MAG: hypothetical protein ACI88H_000680 [Cocleimonas sp.]|jgi:hypothetical protein
MKKQTIKPDLTLKLLKSMMKKSDGYVFNYADAQRLRFLLDIFTVEKNVKGVDSYEH